MDPLQVATQQAQPQPSEQEMLDATTQALKKKRAQLSDALTPQQDQNNAPISQALATLSPNSKDPASKVGGALNTKDYSNLCLAFVDDATGNTNRQPTAIADYQVNAQAGNIKTEGTPPKGSRIYFAPTPDNPAGHVALSNGDGSMTGATTNQGIKTFTIDKWEKYAGQQYIGYAPSGSK